LFRSTVVCWANIAPRFPFIPAAKLLDPLLSGKKLALEVLSFLFGKLSIWHISHSLNTMIIFPNDKAPSSEGALSLESVNGYSTRKVPSSREVNQDHVKYANRSIHKRVASSVTVVKISFGGGRI
jgi:hypothetical protein